MMLNQLEIFGPMLWKREIFSSAVWEGQTLVLCCICLTRKWDFSGTATKSPGLPVDPLPSCGYSIFKRFISFTLSLPLHWGGRLSLNPHAGCLTTFYFIVCCSPVSHPQQRPPGHHSSAGCHGETIPARAGVASGREGRSGGCGGELFSPLPVVPEPACDVDPVFSRLQVSGRGIKSCTEVEVLTEDRWAECCGVSLRQMCGSSRRVLTLWTGSPAPTLSAALGVSKEVSLIWHVDSKQHHSAAWSDFSGLFRFPRGGSHRPTAEAGASQGQHGEAGITRKGNDLGCWERGILSRI